MIRHGTSDLIHFNSWIPPASGFLTPSWISGQCPLTVCFLFLTSEPWESLGMVLSPFISRYDLFEPDS